METRNITYYKTINSIIFNDGFEVPAGTKVQFNFAEGQVYNVQFKKYNEKRIFWIHNSELELFKTVKENWLKKEIEEHNIDLNDKWFEYEKQKISESKNKKRNSTYSITGTDRERPKQPKKSTTGSSRTSSKAGIPVKTRKKATAKTKSKRTTRKVK